MEVVACMKINQELYGQAKMDARKIAEITTQLEYLALLKEQNVLVEGKIRDNYEESRLRDIKNLISNIYLVLDLHEVKGIADEIFNSEFKPKF